METGKNGVAAERICALLIRATGLNASFETAIPADVAEAGSCLVFCEKLRGALLALPAGETEFSCGGASATLRPKERKALFEAARAAAVMITRLWACKRRFSRHKNGRFCIRKTGVFAQEKRRDLWQWKN